MFFPIASSGHAGMRDALMSREEGGHDNGEQQEVEQINETGGEEPRAQK